MTVADVLEYLAGGMTQEELLAEFPDLTAEDIRACLAFAVFKNKLYKGTELNSSFQSNRVRCESECKCGHPQLPESQSIRHRDC